tara:strand:- start:235 stop:1230 length:996 start_codon:yes stop_codon:yes gene_type:complete
MDIKKLMAEAVRLSIEHKYTTKPNPVVGALLYKNGRIVSSGAHEYFGGPHAEVNCIDKVDSDIKKEDLTLFCTLEPCNHTGKTPPCTDKIISSGIKKIIIGVVDPNPLVSGQGIKKLKDAGIDVTVGVLEKEIKSSNEFYFFKHENKRPFITIKIAQTIDNFAADINGKPIKITSEKSNQDVQSIRALHDVIVTGGNTLRNDNPKMNARVDFILNQPKRVLLSTETRADLKLNFFKDDHFQIINDVDLKKVIQIIYEQNFNSILVEAGPKLVESFLKDGLCDRLISYQSPRPHDNQGISWSPVLNIIEKNGFNLTSSYTIDRDIKRVFIND